MTTASRFTVSVDPTLLQAFDKLSEREGFSNRSEAVKSLMRSALIEREWEDGSVVAGALVLVYDHHRRELAQKLMDVQHDYSQIVISTQHVHLDHDNCLEVVTLTGDAGDIHKLVTAVKSIKGLKHCALVMTTMGQQIA